MAFKHKPHYNVRNRPNKLAKGMTQTAYHCGHVGKMSADAGRLTVFGTCDKLARILPWNSEQTKEVCSHCGGRLPTRKLNKFGRIRLRRIRRRRDAKLNAGLTPDLKALAK